MRSIQHDGLVVVVVVVVVGLLLTLLCTHTGAME
jgi:hypothetical protein